MPHNPSPNPTKIQNDAPAVQRADAPAPGHAGGGNAEVLHRLSAMEGGFSAMQQRLSAVEGGLGAVQGEVAEVKNDVGEVKIEVAKAQTRMDSLATKEDLEAQGAKLAADIHAQGAELHAQGVRLGEAIISLKAEMVATVKSLEAALLTRLETGLREQHSVTVNKTLPTYLGLISGFIILTFGVAAYIFS